MPHQAAESARAAIDWTAVGSIVSAIAVIVAVVALIWESRASRFAIGVEILVGLNTEFESDSFRRKRKVASAYLQDRTTGDSEKGRAAVYDVLNFFSMVAFFQNRGALDTNAVWFTFAYYLLPYYRLSKQEIAEKQEREPVSYQTLDKLYNSVFQIEEEKRGAGLALPAPDQSDATFVAEEAALT